jgi:hypothetical protein
VSFLLGSDARIIMGNNEAALVRLWQEKRGEAEPEDLSRNLLVASPPKISIGAGTGEYRAGHYGRAASFPLPLRLEAHA